MKAVVSGIVCLLLIGCAAPLVVYDKVNGPDTEGKTKFQLSESLVKFDFPVEGTGVAAAPNKKKLAITSVPVADSSNTYTIAGTGWSENWFVTTDINVTHTGDSLLLKQVGSKITDQRTAMIGTAGSVIADALALFGARSITTPAPPTQERAVPPTGILIDEFLSKIATNSSKCTVNPGNSNKLPRTARDASLTCKHFELEGGELVIFVVDSQGKVVNENGKPKVVSDDGRYYADIDIGAVPDDAFMPPTFPYKSRSLLYSACRTLHVTVTNKMLGDGWKTEASLVFADPHWLESMKLPPNGKVVLGDSCGADATADSYTASTALDYLKSAGDAAKTIKDSLNKSSSTGTGTKK